MRAGIYLYFLLWAACLGAQTTPLEGELVTQKPTDLSHLIVRLEMAGHGNPEQAFVGMAGSFRFAALPPGDYTLTVLDERGTEITRQHVEVTPATRELKVQLPEPPGTQQPEGGVSVAQLRHKPDRRAMRDWLEARKRSEAGDHQGAAALLEEAVERDPQFAEAHANLGAQYVRLRDPARGAAEFQKAIGIDATSALYQADLALALAQLGRREEAFLWSRRALQIDSTSAVGHYVIGWLLSGSEATRAEAIRHLEIAVRSLPAAQVTLDAIRRQALTR